MQMSAPVIPGNVNGKDKQRGNCYEGGSHIQSDEDCQSCSLKTVRERLREGLLRDSLPSLPRPALGSGKIQLEFSTQV